MASGTVRRRHSRTCPVTTGGRNRRCRCAAGWQYRFRTPDGTRYEAGGFPTRQDADEAMRRLQGDLEANAWRPPPKDIGFGEYAERWLAQHRARVKASTHTDYAAVIRNHLVPWFGDTPISAIRIGDIKAYLAAKAAARRDDGRPVWGAKTINNTLVPLKRMLRDAVEDEYLMANPAASVRPLPYQPPEREILTPDELRRIADAAGERWGTLITTAAFTGLRRGELLGLRWGDLELGQGRLFVRQTYTQHGFGTPKSRAGRRVVPLTAALIGELRRHKLRQPANEHDLVFASNVGTPIDPRNLEGAWARALRKAGIRHLPFHCLRHTAVSLLIAHEHLNPKQLQSVIGHASIALTYDLYGHLLPDSFEGFGAGLDAALAPRGDTAGDTAANLAM